MALNMTQLDKDRPFLHYDLCFDLDGTLIDTAPDLVRVTNESIALDGLPPTEFDLARKDVGYGSKALLKNAFERASQPVSDDRITELQTFFLKRYADTIADNSQPFPDVVSTLTTLKQQGARLTVCTNKPGYLARPLIDALEMTHFFEAIIGGDEAPKSKPDPSHIFAAAGPKIKGRKLIMIGDSYPDIQGGRNAGIPTILMDYGYTTIAPIELNATITLSRFADIPDVLNRL